MYMCTFVVGVALKDYKLKEISAQANTNFESYSIFGALEYGIQ